MGGWQGALSEGLEKAFGDEIGTGLGKVLSSAEGVLSRSEGGRYILGLHKNVFEPTMAREVQSRTAPVIQQYKTAGATGPLPIKTEKITRDASRTASAATYGPNHERIAAGLIAMKQQGMSDTYIKNSADHIAMLLQDTYRRGQFEGPRDPVTGIKQYSGYQETSRSKYDVSKNRRFFQTGIRLNTGAVRQDSNMIERRFNNYASSFMAPMIWAAHLTTPFNLMFAPTWDLVKGLTSLVVPGGYQKTKFALLNTGIYNEEVLNNLRQLYEYRNGIVGKAGAPGIGYILGKTFHSPGFSTMRDLTLTMAGSTGRFAVEDYARTFTKNGSKIAEARLRELGLNPARIRQQGGKLLPEDYQTAIYKFVDRHVFLGSKSLRPYLYQSTTVGRMMNMYHNYVSRQANLVGRELLFQYQHKNFIGAAKTMAILGVVFPAVGAAVNELEMLLRGQWDQKQLEEPLSAISGDEGTFAQVLQYFDFVSHVGAFAMGESLSRAILRNELLGYIMGPAANMATRDATDMLSYMWRKAEYEGGGIPKDPDSSQVMRDLLETVGPINSGRIAAHRFFPTRSEQKERREEYEMPKFKEPFSDKGPFDKEELFK